MVELTKPDEPERLDYKEAKVFHQLFPRIDYAEAELSRQVILSDSSFMALINLVHRMMRQNSTFFEMQSKLQSMKFIQDRSEFNALMQRRQAFIESFLPIMISLIYKEKKSPAFGRLRYLYQYGDDGQFEDFASDVYHHLTDAVVSFEWKREDPERQVYAFINWLKKSLAHLNKRRLSVRTEPLEQSEETDARIYQLKKQILRPTEEEAFAKRLHELLIIKLKTDHPLLVEVYEGLLRGDERQSMCLRLNIEKPQYDYLRRRVLSFASIVFEIESPAGKIYDRDTINKVSAVYETKKLLLSPAQRVVAEAMIASTTDEPYDEAAEVLHKTRKYVGQNWSIIVKTILLARKPDSNRHGRRAFKGAEIAKLRASRALLLKNVFGSADSHTLLQSNCMPHHYDILSYAHMHPDKGVKEIARKFSLTRNVVANAYKRAFVLFPEITQQVINQI